MKQLLTFAATIVMLLPTQAQKRLGGYPITPVTFTSVKVAPNSFWGQRLEASRKVTIPLAFSKCEETGRYKNFEHAAAHLKQPHTSKTRQRSFPSRDTASTTPIPIRPLRERAISFRPIPTLS